MYKARYSCRISIKFQFPRQIFEKYLNIEFRENPSSWSRFAPYGRTEGHTDDMTKLTVSFSNFMHAPKTQTKKETLTVTEFSLPANLLIIIQ